MKKRAVHVLEALATLATLSSCWLEGELPRIGGESTPPPVCTADGTGSVESQLEAMGRWNRVVEAAPPTRLPVPWDFYWRQLHQFPHPTFKGGSGDAYREFADLLLAYFRRDDNFQFLAKNCLFRTDLRHCVGEPTTECLEYKGLGTFEMLALYLASGPPFAAIPDDVRQALQEFADRM